MNDERMRAECDRILTEMVRALEPFAGERMGRIEVNGELYVMKKALCEDDASTFRKIHIIGEANAVLLGLGFDINSTDWYDHVPYYRNSELIFNEGN